MHLSALRRAAALATVLTLAATGTAAATGGHNSANSRTLFATTDQNQLIQFESKRPERVKEYRTITGLPAGVTSTGSPPRSAFIRTTRPFSAGRPSSHQAVPPSSRAPERRVPARATRSAEMGESQVPYGVTVGWREARSNCGDGIVLTRAADP